MTIRVMLADDHLMFRETLRTPLAAHPDIEVIGEAGTGAETLSLLESLKPDVLVLDINLPDMSGIDVAREAIRRHPGLRVVALSGYADRIYIEAMLKAGAYGYVVKSAGAKELFVAIQSVAGGTCFLSQEAAQVMVQSIKIKCEDSTPAKSVLTAREVEVLCLLAEGKRSADVAVALGISTATADVHRRNIKAKLGLHSAVELTRYAIRENLITT
ncbi:MAG: response regulator transcription factor [Alphaproteobacteria bacterium]|nr:response regulator transcription factor [Alphaproteobacteria bacterium]